MVQADHGYLLLGPMPAVEYGELLIGESMRHFNLPETQRVPFTLLMRSIPCEDVMPFRRKAAYLARVLYGMEISEWHYVDFPPQAKHPGEVRMRKSDATEFDEAATQNRLFGERVITAILYGKVDELEKELGNMTLFFPPVMESTISKEEMHDIFVLGLAHAAIAANEGGLSNSVMETMMKHYLQLLRRAMSFRDMVRLMKMMLNDFAARTHQAQMIETSDGMTMRICRDIENHLHEKLQPSDIAARLGISVQYLCTVFKKNTGKTVTEYINERKIAESRYLLSKEHAKITEVAMELGYSSPNYFSTVFRQVTGKTPNAWQKKVIHLSEESR